MAQSPWGETPPDRAVETPPRGKAPSGAGSGSLPPCGPFGGWAPAGGGGGRLRRLRRPLAVDAEDLDPFGELEHRRDRVFPGEVQVVAAAVAGVAVVADPAERRPGAVLARLGPVREPRDRPPARVAAAVAVQRHDVDGEPVVVVGVAHVAAVAADVRAVGQRPGVPVGDEDRVALRDPAQVGDDPPVDHVPRFVRDRGRDRHDPARRVDRPRRQRRRARRTGSDGESCDNDGDRNRSLEHPPPIGDRSQFA